MKNNTESGKTEFTDKQKQELKKYTFIGLLVMICLGVIWFIFKPSDTEIEAEKEKIGINTEIPEAGKTEMTDNKQHAFEQDYLDNKKNKRVQTLNNFALLAAEKGKTDTINNDSLVSIPIEERKANIGENQPYVPSSSIQRSVDTYKQTNEAVSSFYTSSASSASSEEVKNLKKEIESLKKQMSGKKEETSRLDEQTALMEKSYELASKYFPQTQSGNPSLVKPVSEISKSVIIDNKDIATVRQLDDDIVSALPQNMDNQEFLEKFSKERNIGFHSSNEALPNMRNTIQVCIDKDQTIVNGQIVSLRLLVAIKVGDLFIPKNTVIFGRANIQNERLDIIINSIEYEESIIDVDLTAHDLDGQKGIFIPDAMEVSTMKEIATNMGSSVGSSINISTDAGAQVASDLATGVIDGTSKYFQKKVSIVKVNLKAGYRLFLVAQI